jgi:hypothetical protein
VDALYLFLGMQAAIIIGLGVVVYGKWFQSDWRFPK